AGRTAMARLAGRAARGGGAHARGPVAGPDRLVAGAPGAGDGNRGQEPEAMQERDPGIAGPVDDRGREHGRLERGFRHRALPEGLRSEEPGALEERGTHRREEDEPPDAGAL